MRRVKREFESLALEPGACSRGSHWRGASWAHTWLKRAPRHRGPTHASDGLTREGAMHASHG